jgi:hypothetical protein
MNRPILRGLILFTILVIFFLLYKEFGLGDKELNTQGYTVRVSEIKIDNLIVQRPLAVHEFSGGVFIDEGEGYETLLANSGYKFVLLHLEIRNKENRPLHLLGRDSKVVVGSDGETYLPGITSREARNSTTAEVRDHYYEQLVSLQTLAPGEKLDGWVVFEMPDDVEPVLFQWYSDFTEGEPSFTVDLR